MKPTKTQIKIAIAYLDAAKRNLLKDKGKNASAKIRMAAIIEAKALEEVIRFLGVLIR